MSEKPEWFELTSDEQGPAKNAGKSGKKNLIKLVAVAAPLILVGAVFVGANGEADDDHKPAINTTIPTATNTTTATTVNSGSAKNETVAPASGKVISTPTTSASAKGGVGVPAPSAKGGDDDHEGFFGGDDNHQRGEHDGREGHHDGDRDHGGSAPKIPQSGSTTTKN
jgi:hypothetical protein